MALSPLRRPPTVRTPRRPGDVSPLDQGLRQAALAKAESGYFIQHSHLPSDPRAAVMQSSFKSFFSYVRSQPAIRSATDVAESHGSQTITPMTAPAPMRAATRAVAGNIQSFTVADYTPKCHAVSAFISQIRLSSRRPTFRPPGALAGPFLAAPLG